MPTTRSSIRSEQPKVEYVPIKVTAGILLHIGAGIYHSVAGALKEMITNAYDADATQVIISTDYPRFEQFKVVDNGMGMTADRFTQAMRSIGSSLKGILGPKRLTEKFNRPIIGKMGIGLMALTQVCEEAVIESQAQGASTKFVATLDFKEFKKRAEADLEQIKVDVMAGRFGGREEMEVLLRDRKTDVETKKEIETLLGLLDNIPNKNSDEELEEEHLGYCLLYADLPAVPGQQGTTITLKSVHPAVRDLLKDVGRSPDNIPKHYKDKYKDASDVWEEYREELNHYALKVHRLRPD